MARRCSTISVPSGEVLSVSIRFFGTTRVTDASIKCRICLRLSTFPSLSPV